jgi:hypothetical protein
LEYLISKEIACCHPARFLESRDGVSRVARLKNRFYSNSLPERGKISLATVVLQIVLQAADCAAEKWARAPQNRNRFCPIGSRGVDGIFCCWH